MLDTWSPRVETKPETRREHRMARVLMSQYCVECRKSFLRTPAGWYVTDFHGRTEVYTEMPECVPWKPRKRA